MPRIWCWFVGSLALVTLAAVPARGATVVERTVRHTIQGDGSVLEESRLQVRLDSPRDLASWSPFPILLDENRSLREVSAHAVKPDGKKVTVKKKHQDTMDIAGEWVLHSSQRLHLLEFPAVPPGSLLHIDYSVVERPYFRAGEIVLALGEETERLRVEVAGGGAGWRWRIDGDPRGLAIEEAAGGVVVTAQALAAPDPPDHAPGHLERGPVLRYAWGPDGDWRAVASWYQALLRDLPRAAPPVRQKAEEILAGVAGRRERLEALLGFVRRQVRYVAVEVGIGGYRPSPPPEVLARRWGDCKDKSLLLIDLLEEAGIEAHPALIRLSRDERIDRLFPSPYHFNHLIVAVPADGVEPREHDPVADGYLFLDPTQERGSARWLHPGVQDQDALVVRGEGSGLARTPIRPEHESRGLVVNLVVTPGGEARGGAGLSFTGGLASALLDALASSPPERAEAAARTLLSDLLPGVTLGNIGWSTADGDVPRLEIAAATHLASFVQGSDGQRSFQLPGLTSTPSPSLVDGREVPLVLDPGIARTSWHLKLPAGWCPPAADPVAVDNEVGRFEQRIARDGDSVTVERRVEIRRRWVEPELFPAFEELALAEHRTARRRLRLDCP